MNNHFWDIMGLIGLVVDICGCLLVIHSQLLYRVKPPRWILILVTVGSLGCIACNLANWYIWR